MDCSASVLPRVVLAIGISCANSSNSNDNNNANANLDRNPNFSKSDKSFDCEGRQGTLTFNHITLTP